MKLKQHIKDSFVYPWLASFRYFFHRYVRSRQFRPYQLKPGARISKVGNRVSFFGYYNISPVNQDGGILFLEVEAEIPRASMVEPANIMLSTSSGETRQIALTAAWNWQQGCMLQWFPGSDGNILFNDYDSAADRYISKVMDTSGNLIARYDIPVNNVSKCGSFALSLNYDRLANMRPDYGYFNKKNQTLPPDDQDGIWYLDLKTGDYRLILSLEALKKLEYVPTMDGAAHKANHIDINLDGTRFMFLHRWIGPQGRFMRLITADPEGSNLYILNGDVMTSHSCWASAEKIISFCEHKGERGYFQFTDKSDNARLLSRKMPRVDGHPSISPDRHWLLTDTYPDKGRISTLFLYNMLSDELIQVGRFHQPLQYKGEMRIDLHPKWSADGNAVFFESGHTGNRQLNSLKLQSVIENLL